MMPTASAGANREPKVRGYCRQDATMRSSARQRPLARRKLTAMTEMPTADEDSTYWHGAAGVPGPSWPHGRQGSPRAWTASPAGHSVLT